MFQPLEEELPYELFSLRVALKDVPDLIPILRWGHKAPAPPPHFPLLPFPPFPAFPPQPRNVCIL